MNSLDLLLAAAAPSEVAAVMLPPAEVDLATAAADPSYIPFEIVETPASSDPSLPLPLPLPLLPAAKKAAVDEAAAEEAAANASDAADNNSSAACCCSHHSNLSAACSRYLQRVRRTAEDYKCPSSHRAASAPSFASRSSASFPTRPRIPT